MALSKMMQRWKHQLDVAILPNNSALDNSVFSKILNCLSHSHPHCVIIFDVSEDLADTVRSLRCPCDAIDRTDSLCTVSRNFKASQA